MTQSLEHLRYALQDPHFLARFAILTACPALACLVAIWAANTRLHWFWRALGLWAAVAIFVPIRAYEPFWLLAASLPLIAAMLWMRTRWQPKLQTVAQETEQTLQVARFHYGLRDLLLMMLVFGLWLVIWIPVVSHYRPRNWSGWIVTVVALAAIAVLAFGCITSQRRLRAAGLLSCALPVIALAIWSAGDGVRWHLIGIGGQTTTLVADLVFLTVAGAEVALIVFGVTMLARLAVSPTHGRRWRLVCGVVLGVLITAFTVPLGYLYVRLLERAPRVPNSGIPANHYHRITQIAKEVQTLNPLDLPVAKLRIAAPASPVPQQLEALYAELLPLLEQANAVDFDIDRDVTPEYGLQISPIQACRALARSLIAESGHARENQAHDSATDHALAVLNLGTMFRRGGLMFDAMFGQGMERFGQSSLAKLRSELPPEQCRKVIAALERSRGLHEDLDAIVARSDYFADQTYRWIDKLEMILDEFSPHVTSGEVSLERWGKHAAAGSALLQADLAIRLYKHEKGELPSELRSLVPEYLTAVPVDPYSAQPLVYRPKSGGEFVLYSVGFDGQNNGGTFGSPTDYNNAQYRKQTGLDFHLETLF